jgi:hypothetical protein
MITKHLLDISTLKGRRRRPQKRRRRPERRRWRRPAKRRWRAKTLRMFELEGSGHSRVVKNISLLLLALIC